MSRSATACCSASTAAPNQIEDEELLILREEEILAKLSGAAKAAKSRGGSLDRSFLFRISHLHEDYQEEFRNGEADCYR